MAVNRYAFIGRRHVGKSTATDIIRSFEGNASVRYAFADPLKNAFVEAFRAFQVAIGEQPTFTREELDANKNYYRQQLEDFGTKFVRDRYAPDFWVQLMKKNLDRTSSHVLIVVDDCRFLNEAELLRSEGFRLVRLYRNDEERAASILETRGIIYPTEEEIKSVLAEKMPSEVEVDDIETDFVVENTGNYSELREELFGIFYT